MALLTVFAAVFVAELGDKTQLSTRLFAADKQMSKLTERKWDRSIFDDSPTRMIWHAICEHFDPIVTTNGAKPAKSSC